MNPADAYRAKAIAGLVSKPEVVVIAKAEAAPGQAALEAMLESVYSRPSRGIDLTGLVWVDVATPAELATALTPTGAAVRMTANIEVAGQIDLTGRYLDTNGHTLASAASGAAPVTMIASSSGGWIGGGGRLDHRKTSNTGEESVFTCATPGDKPLAIHNITLGVVEYAGRLDGAFDVRGCAVVYNGVANNAHTLWQVLGVAGDSYLDDNTFVAQAQNGLTRYTSFMSVPATSWVPGAVLHVRRNVQAGGDLRSFVGLTGSPAIAAAGSLVISGNEFDDSNGGVVFNQPNALDGFASIALIGNTQGGSSKGNFRGLLSLDMTGPAGLCSITHYGNNSLAGDLASGYVSISGGSGIVARSPAATGAVVAQETTRPQIAAAHAQVVTTLAEGQAFGVAAADQLLVIDATGKAAAGVKTLPELLTDLTNRPTRPASVLSGNLAQWAADGSLADAQTSVAGVISAAVTQANTGRKQLGLWNAYTNTPTLPAVPVTDVGDYYEVTFDGFRFGITWQTGDAIMVSLDAAGQKIWTKRATLGDSFDGQSLYVAKSGANANSGTILRPLAGLDVAVQMVAPPALISVGAGTFQVRFGAEVTIPDGVMVRGAGASFGNVTEIEHPVALGAAFLRDITFGAAATVTWASAGGPQVEGCSFKAAVRTGVDASGVAGFSDCDFSASPGLDLSAGSGTLYLNRCAGVKLTVGPGWTVYVDACFDFQVLSLDATSRVIHWDSTIGKGVLSTLAQYNDLVASSNAATFGLYVMGAAFGTHAMGDLVIKSGLGLRLLRQYASANPVLHLESGQTLYKSGGGSWTVIGSSSAQVYYRGDAALHPASPGSGDILFITSTGAAGGSLLRSYLGASGSWVKIQDVAWQPKVTYAANLLAAPASPVAGDHLITTSTGLSTGTVTGVYLSDGTNWLALTKRQPTVTYVAINGAKATVANSIVGDVVYETDTGTSAGKDLRKWVFDGAAWRSERESELVVVDFVLTQVTLDAIKAASSASNGIYVLGFSGATGYGAAAKGDLLVKTGPGAMTLYKAYASAPSVIYGPSNKSWAREAGYWSEVGGYVESETGEVIIAAGATKANAAPAAVPGASMTLPSAGQYRIRFEVAVANNTAGGQTRFLLRNDTAAQLLGSSAVYSKESSPGTFPECVAKETFVTVAGPADISLWWNTNGTGTSTLVSNAAIALSTMTYEKVSGFLPLEGTLPYPGVTHAEALTLTAFTGTPAKGATRLHDYIEAVDDGSGWVKVYFAYSQTSAGTGVLSPLVLKVPGGLKFNTTRHPIQSSASTGDNMQAVNDEFKYLIPCTGNINVNNGGGYDTLLGVAPVSLDTFCLVCAGTGNIGMGRTVNYALTFAQYSFSGYFYFKKA